MSRFRRPDVIVVIWCIGVLTACQQKQSTPEELAAEYLTVSGTEEQVRTSLEMTASALGPEQAAALKGLLDPAELSKRMVPLYVKRFTPKELKGLIAFYRSPVGAKLREQTPALMKEAGEVSQALLRERIAVVAMATMGGGTNGLEGQITAAKQRRTMGDIRSTATSVEAYAVDNSLYPAGDSLRSIESAVSPTYIRILPVLDGWETPMSYRVSKDRSSYRIVSAGADGVFEDGIEEPGRPGAAGETTDPSRDIVYEDGKFIQYPKGLNR